MVFKRAVAFMLDWFIIILYALILAFVAFRTGRTIESPVMAQLVGLVTLTLPVFFYFFLCERSGKHATIGKSLMNLKVLPVRGSGNYLFRNILKFLPWEIAHTGVHWLFYYENQGAETPVWVFLLLIIPQIIMILYLASVILRAGRSSFYDRLAGTEINSTDIKKI